ncbi:hypothetical protein HBH71_253960 [Parastagonospora nodorum]|nr:hypothetical protein HBH71_253960 [Parastagonospora nodorum]
MAAMAQPVVTDLMLRILSTTDAPPAYVSHLQKWYCIPTDLYLYTSKQSAWLYVKYADEKDLSAKDLVVVDITVGESPGDTWESRSGGIWMLRSKFSGKIDQAVTKVDVLFGTDAVDPRLHWDLMTSPLQLNALPSTPVARLSVLHGAKPRPDTQTPLRVEADGTFKMMLFSDSHMGTDKPCKDAIDANGKKLPEFEADPRTVDLMGKMLDKENPNLVVILGDLLHHDIRHSKTALFKLVAPIIKRKIPFAAVFGNHDDEGPHALSREALMSILQDMPLNLSEAGPDWVDGVGNFCIDVLPPAGSDIPILTLYFLDSHGGIPRKLSWKNDYYPIHQSQIKWFVETAQARRRAHEEPNDDNPLHISLAFQHIPLPEFGDHNLRIRSGYRGEATEGPGVNTGFYAALARARLVALFCGHDHVNDFCALLPQQTQENSNKFPHSGPWLCYGGAVGFGGYCSYGKKFFHRRGRAVELNINTKRLTTWTRGEYAEDRVDELVLFQNGSIVDA